MYLSNVITTINNEIKRGPQNEYWNCKVGFWFFKLIVGYSAYMLCLQLECCALNFQERVIMLHCNSAAKKWTWACDRLKTSNLSADNFKNTRPRWIKPEPAIRSGDTGQWIPCFDSCQLITTWMCNIRLHLDSQTS